MFFVWEPTAGFFRTALGGAASRLLWKGFVRGCITERDFEEAERCFPGIATFYRDLARKPATFLELVWAYLDAVRARGEERAVAASRSRP